MNKKLLILLGLSVFFLTFVYFTMGRFLGFYYILWLGGVGTYVWRHRVSLEEKLSSWTMGSFKKFLALGVLMILIEETFAGITMNLGYVKTLGAVLHGITQFWALNLLALPGFIIAWYFLMRRYAYSRKEIFILVGLWGLISEKTLMHFVTFPIMALALLLPTMYTYALIIAPSVMSYRGPTGKDASRFVRYIAAFVLPFIVTVPFIGLLLYLRTHYPDVFPPKDLVP